MRNSGSGIMKWFSGVSTMFAGSIIIYIIIAGIYGRYQVEARLIVSLLIMAALGTTLQIVAFTELVIKKMRYSFRIIVFTVPFLRCCLAVLRSLSGFRCGSF